MNAHSKLNSNISRRQVMIGAAGLSFAVAFGGSTQAASTAVGKAMNSLGRDRARRHHHDHVGRDRDGAGLDDLAAIGAGGGIGRRLVQGPASCPRR